MHKKTTKKLTRGQIKECLWLRFWKLFIRLRDTNYDWWGYCISSSKKLYWTEGQAGHYCSNASSKIHTWNPYNVNLQSMNDNVYKHGNLLRYRDALIMKIGEVKVKELEETKAEIKQWKDWELVEMIKVYRQTVVEMTAIKSAKVQKEILAYVKQNDKKMRQVLYG